MATSATIAYATPEILKKQPYSYSCDVYSWGCTMVYLATGFIPDRNTQPSVTWGIHLKAGKASQGRALNARNLHFYGIVAKALSENPAERYPSAAELLEALKQIPETSGKKPAPDFARAKLRERGWTDPWKSSFNMLNYVFIYEKAFQNQALLKQLENLKKSALEETKDHFVRGGEPASQFDHRDDWNKDALAETVAKSGITDITGSLTQPVITVKLSKDFPKVCSAATFYILCRLAAFDGGYNILHPRVTVLIDAPFAGKMPLKRLDKLVNQFSPGQISHTDLPSRFRRSLPSPSPASPNRLRRLLRPLPHLLHLRL